MIDTLLTQERDQLNCPSEKDVQIVMIEEEKYDLRCDSSQLVNHQNIHSPATSTSTSSSSCPLQESINTCTSSSSPSSSWLHSTNHTFDNQNNGNGYIDIQKGSNIRLKVKVLVPVDDHPNVRKNVQISVALESIPFVN